ncbi:conserved exported protein of unknown function [Sterolibacterium denitrificans]|uniref:Tetratricopeptide repeat-like domain-containing protein n=1 Tax=Sterolibacterium denitrificans TaxID=157592 RepID=A0A7Z7HPU2_9PROT|nr:tetratricopeptide repeat protein [Sterolibacterium denitrificans]SMB21887.1 conserved exported protein of unknown function [Sterolibacterium denitrificans]
MSCRAGFLAWLGLPLAVLAAPAMPGDGGTPERRAEAETEVAAVKTEPAVTQLTPELLYQILLAEIAGNRGSIPLATHLYADLAKATRDPRIARRATEVALYVRQTELALESAQIWVATAPESAEARQAIAGLLLNARQPEAALPHLAKLLTIEMPPAAGADAADDDETPLSVATAVEAGGLARLNQVYRLLAHYPDKIAALRMIEQLTAGYATLAEAQLIRAQASLDAKDDARALAAIDRAIALRPDWEPAVLFKAQVQRRISSKQAGQTLQDFLATHPDSSEVRLAYARILIGDKHYEAARREFGTLLKMNRDNPEVLYPVALLSMQLNDLPTAEKHLKRLLELSNEKPGININLLRYYLGQIAEENQQVTEALDWYTKVTPGEQYLPALGRATALLVKQGRLEDGRALLRQAAESNPQERVQLLIAEAQLLASNGQIDAAYALLSQRLAAEPDQPTLLYETALLAEKLKHYDIMERHLRRLIRLKPDDAHAYNALGYSLADQGLRLDEARQLIDQGLALAPEDAFILDSKGWLLYRSGEKAAALEVLRKAYDVRPDAEIAAHLGEVLWISGMQEEAAKTWQESAKSNPDNQLLKDTMQKFLGPQPQGEQNAPPAPVAE